MKKERTFREGFGGGFEMAVMMVFFWVHLGGEFGGDDRLGMDWRFAVFVPFIFI